MKPEYRYCEIRQDGRTLEGVAIRYGDVARIGVRARERFEPRAFGNLESADVILNVAHDRARPLARTGAGLFLVDTAESLTVRAELPNTREADDVLELIKAGVLRGLSIEFLARQKRFEGEIRVVSDAALTGLGVVDRPAYRGSAVSARSATDQRRRLWL